MGPAFRGSRAAANCSRSFLGEHACDARKVGRSRTSRTAHRCEDGIVTEYRGLTVRRSATAQQLRGCRRSTRRDDPIAKLAIADADSRAPPTQGPTGMVISNDDPSSSRRRCKRSPGQPAFVLKAGLVDGQFFPPRSQGCRASRRRTPRAQISVRSGPLAQLVGCAGLAT